MELDRQALKTAVLAGLREAWGMFVERHGDDQVYGLILETNPMVDAVDLAVLTEESLTEAAERHIDRLGLDLEDQEAMYRWRLVEAPYRAFSEASFDAARAVLDAIPLEYDETGDADRARALALRTFEEALRAAKDEGVFVGAAERAVLAVFVEGASDEDRVASVGRLNSSDVADRFEAELEQAEDVTELAVGD